MVIELFSLEYLVLVYLTKDFCISQYDFKEKNKRNQGYYGIIKLHEFESLKVNMVANTFNLRNHKAEAGSTQ